MGQVKIAGTVGIIALNFKLSQRIGSQAFSSSVTPATSIMRNSENGGYSEIILIRDNTGKQCLC